MTCKQQTRLTEHTVKAPKWKNLHFLRDGTSYLGRLVFKSEIEARTEHEKEMALGQRRGLDPLYSHAIQVPWR